MKTRLFCLLAASALAAARAQADITYVSGTQTSTGTVDAFPAGVHVTQSYDIAAPDPLMSWAPPDQAISVVSGLATANVHSSYSSTLDPDQLTLHAAASSHATWQASTTFAQTTTVSMTFSEPTTVYLAAHVVRQSLMNISINDMPMSLRFGRDGDTPILDFTYAGQNHWDAAFPGTQLVLDPGTYTLSSFNHVYQVIAGSIDDAFGSSIDFSLTVPAPAAFAPMLVFMGAAGVRRPTRRRRDEDDGRSAPRGGPSSFETDRLQTY